MLFLLGDLGCVTRGPSTPSAKFSFLSVIKKIPNAGSAFTWKKRLLPERESSVQPHFTQSPKASHWQSLQLTLILIVSPLG